MIRFLSFLPALALAAGAAFAQDAATPETAPKATPEAAQEAPAPMDDDAAYESARNQLGILKFCEAQGHNDSTAVEIQEKLLTMLPSGDAAKGDAAEALGAQGTVSAMGAEQSLQTAAEAQDTTVEALCQQMDALIQQLAAQLPE